MALVLRHVIRRIRARWPKVDILVRGDSHYGRPEAMTWCERNRVGYLFGLAGNKVLLRRVAALAEQVALERVEGGAAKVRRFGEFAYAARPGAALVLTFAATGLAITATCSRTAVACFAILATRGQVPVLAGPWSRARNGRFPARQPRA